MICGFAANSAEQVSDPVVLQWMDQAGSVPAAEDVLNPLKSRYVTAPSPSANIQPSGVRNSGCGLIDPAMAAAGAAGRQSLFSMIFLACLV